jgi:uncharacterized protein
LAFKSGKEQSVNLKLIIHEILKDYALPIYGDHGDGHTHERTHPDITIQSCWDSDRLDPGPVGITPHPGKLCTEVAKTKEMIQWADGRASFRFVPKFVKEDWGIEVPKQRI